jgi:divalent metal cation (Fe/Co/Zn/Cd) transporter
MHNFGDAATVGPLWIAFALMRLETSRRFPFGYGRFEDLGGC